jgi:hypothetical protein
MAPQILVIQNGARHEYAIPSAFARAGVLAGVYTDFTACHGLGRLVSWFGSGHPKVAPVLQRRSPPREIADQFHATDMAFLVGEFGRRLAKTEKRREEWIRHSKELAERAMLARGTGQATHIYSMLGEGGRFVEAAKERGLGVVGDVYIALSSDEIVAKEAEVFADWVDEMPRGLDGPGARAPNQVLLDCSDLLVCPSEFVRDDLVHNHGVDHRKTHVVPYAVSPRWLSLPTSPEPGRLLFAGSATLRKGIHYLAEAAHLLGGGYQVVVAGGATEKVQQHPAAASLIFLGQLSKAAMAAEFARADVFVFPSLAEGAASVTAEALGAGVPVVTTRAAGSIVRDGIDGIIVPERDPAALAEAVRSIVEDRDRRDAMGRSARERAQQFTWDGFASQVIDATQRISERLSQ